MDSPDPAFRYSSGNKIHSMRNADYNLLAGARLISRIAMAILTNHFESRAVLHISFQSKMSLRSNPPHSKHFSISFPESRIVQVTLSRPEKLNCIDKTTSNEIAKVWELFDQDETLWVGIITGTGRAFCTGADLDGMMTVQSDPLGVESHLAIQR